ncbi:MAG: ribose ABC transporter permease [Treponema sp.]|jgi:ribose/xylose/arabinose/galactoside ABC-type transport system permease subunit|nr:ribose ABC transporter permease [Treponema sp.]
MAFSFTHIKNIRNLLQRFGLLVVILVIVAVMSLIKPVFLSGENILNVLRQVSINGILAVGITFVIMTGGIDLSIGSIVAVTAVLVGSFLEQGHSLVAAITVGMIGAVLFGILNGILISISGLPPFIATLSNMTIARGAAMVYSNGRNYVIMHEKFLQIGKGYALGIPNPIWILLVVCVIAYVLLNYTIFGRHILAFGGNRHAAKLAGVRTKLVEASAYFISGLLSGVAAIVLVSRTSTGQPIAGTGYELDAIAAAAIGGTSMTGGSGSIGGTVMGFIIIGIMLNSLTLLNVSSFYQQIVKGIIIIVAVMLDMQAKRRIS